MSVSDEDIVRTTFIAPSLFCVALLETSSICDIKTNTLLPVALGVILPVNVVLP